MSENNLALITLRGSNDFGRKVDDYLREWKNTEKSFILDTCCPRFGSGEAKGLVKETIRDKDVYILVDVCNYSITYNMFGAENRMSPDDHFQDLKRMIMACSGKAKKITVIMPFLYEGRQHKRSHRESLDCAHSLQELVNMGVHDIITIDAHDPRMQNSVPLNGFETISPAFQFIRAYMETNKDVYLDKDHVMIIAPDEGATDRAAFLANVLGVNMGMFYKKRDYTTIVNGKNPIVAHEFLGDDLNGKDAIIIDDMISSGDSMLDVARQIKDRGANRIFAFATFGLFTNGLENFDKAVEDGIIYRVYTTNSIYQTPELLSRDWYYSVWVEEYIAKIIYTLNNKQSISKLITPSIKLKEYLDKRKSQQ